MVTNTKLAEILGISRQWLRHLTLDLGRVPVVEKIKITTLRKQWTNEDAVAIIGALKKNAIQVRAIERSIRYGLITEDQALQFRKYRRSQK